MSDRSHRRWHDVRTMLTDWLAWLDDTQHWAETMAAADTSAEPTEPPVSGAETLSGTSLTPASEAAEASDDAAPRSDLYALLAAMTALRQEVTLQTRSARRDREQAAETLEILSSVVDRLSREAEEEETSPAVDAVHVDVLLELHDALSRAERQASQVIASTVDTLYDWRTRHEIETETETDEASEAMPLAACAPDATTKASTLRRLRGWFGGAAKSAVEPSTVAGEPTDDAATAGQETAWAEIGAEAGRMADRFEGLVTGYRLSLQRLERTLSTCGIEPISCLGQSVDPELMEVVQIVSDSTKPRGIVTVDVRCGYRRQGRVYRFAQVVATR
jgi:hypothetical protein